MTSQELKWEDPDVIEGIKLLVQRTATDHPYFLIYRQMLGQALERRYKTSGNIDDLEATLQNHQIVLDHTSAEDPSRAECLRHLAVAFGDRYLKLGDTNDLQNALHKFEEAVVLIPEGHPDRVRCIRNLAVAFTLRYQSLGDLKDLDLAQRNYETAVKMTAEAPLQTLGPRDRYQRLGDLVNPESAVQKFQAAMDISPEGHSDRAAYLHSLAVVFSQRYQRLGDQRNLEAALESEHEAVALTPEGHPVKVTRLQHLAACFQDQYEALGDSKDLEAALQTYRDVVNLTVPGHPERPGQLQGLAKCYAHCYQRLQDPRDLDAVQMHYTVSFDTPTSTPEQSWRAALEWATFSERFRPTESVTAYSEAFKILPEILWVGHTISVRQDAIHRLGIEKVTSNAVKTCINLFALSSAVEIMEQGLATVFQQILQLKTNVQGLDPLQMEAFQKLSYELYNGTSSNLRELAEERNKLLVNIRKQPGLEYFLLPKPYSALQQAAQLGPITILNSNKASCDAILIIHSHTEPLHITLPNVTHEGLQSQQNMLQLLLRRCNVRNRGDSESTRLFGRPEDFALGTTEECFANILAWIWAHVVGPVYQLLKSHNIQGGRLWWLPTGAFTGLPLHACPPTNDFIHSYTATLGSLLEGHIKPSTSQPKFGIVGVTHTGTSKMNFLKGVEQEVKEVISIIKKHDIECLNGEQATIDAVKLQLLNCSWVHLACHGKQDLVEPMKSCLLLHGNNLELETILQMPLHNAQFVFLAACQTAMGDSALVNESFHLGGGFLAAGFRGAVGTLWSMHDADGPLVAKGFYSYLCRDGSQPQLSDAAEALHHAVQELKARKLPHERWIPFIHMGV